MRLRHVAGRPPGNRLSQASETIPFWWACRGSSWLPRRTRVEFALSQNLLTNTSQQGCCSKTRAINMDQCAREMAKVFDQIERASCAVIIPTYEVDEAPRVERAGRQSGTASKTFRFSRDYPAPKLHKPTERFPRPFPPILKSRQSLRL